MEGNLAVLEQQIHRAVGLPMSFEMVSTVVELRSGILRCVVCNGTQVMEGSGVFSKADSEFCCSHYSSCYCKRKVDDAEVPETIFVIECQDHWEKTDTSFWCKFTSVRPVPCPQPGIAIPSELARNFAIRRARERLAKPFDADQFEDGELVMRGFGKLKTTAYRIRKITTVTQLLGGEEFSVESP